MSEVQMKVLKLIEDGKVTPEEGVKLLNALKETSREEHGPKVKFFHHSPLADEIIDKKIKKKMNKTMEEMKNWEAKFEKDINPKLEKIGKIIEKKMEKLGDYINKYIENLEIKIDAEETAKEAEETTKDAEETAKEAEEIEVEVEYEEEKEEDES